MWHGFTNMGIIRWSLAHWYWFLFGFIALVVLGYFVREPEKTKEGEKEAAADEGDAPPKTKRKAKIKRGFVSGPSGQ